MKNIRLFLIISLLSFGLSNQSFSQTTSIPSTDTQSVQTSIVKVKGVGCSKDIKSISENVSSLEGVETCKLQKKGATTTFKVSFDPTRVSENEIYSAIENTASCTDPNDRPYKVKNKKNT